MKNLYPRVFFDVEAKDWRSSKKPEEVQSRLGQKAIIWINLSNVAKTCGFLLVQMGQNQEYFTRTPFWPMYPSNLISLIKSTTEPKKIWVVERRRGGALKHHLYGVLANHEQVERELTPIPGGCPMPALQRFWVHIGSLCTAYRGQSHISQNIA